MGVQDLQVFMESKSVSGGAVNVDLLRIARNVPPSRQSNSTRGGRGGGVRNQISQNNRLKLVVDGECCLDRLYGGYFSDWACGGQWNKTIHFLSLLINTMERGNIELAVVFNGALEPQRMNEWREHQSQTRERVNKVFRHINTKGTPPPKVWWTPPVCLRTVLRMALRHLGVTVLCSMDDHHQEVIAYCRENGYHGLLADDAEYAVFDPPRYFSSEHLKLTYKGSLETKEYMVSEMSKSLEISRDQLCIVAALLGNYLLHEHDLKDFYIKIGAIGGNENSLEVMMKTVTAFVKSLPDTSNLDLLVTEVFGSTNDKQASLLRQSVQYYLNGTKEGFLRYRSSHSRRNNKKNKERTVQPNGISLVTQSNFSSVQNKTEEQDLDMSGFASETIEREQKSLEDYKLAIANAVITPEIIIDNPSEPDCSSSKNTSGLGSSEDYDSSAPSSNNSRINGQVNGAVPSASLLISSSSSSSSSITASPARVPSLQKKTENEKQSSAFKSPYIAPEVLRTASERHQKGLMSPFILQALTSGEVRLPFLLEDEQHRELPSVYSLYRPIRQNIYAILFNLHHIQYVAKNKEKEGEKVETPEVHINEWVWNRNNNYEKPETVRAEPLGWGVPTIQRLWFGSALDDKRRRLRALLTCLRSDTPLMLNPSYVPQHLLIMACVLRYIMSIPDKRILRRQELDAFIAQAFAPELMNSQYLQELTLPLVTSRGVQLATMFMQGVETALIANDACGAPIPWLMCCPWLFFDGKLFHHKLARAGVVKNLLELCENHIEHVVKVERMRKAILEGLNVQFASILPSLGPGTMIRPGLPPPNCLPAMNLPSARRCHGLGRRPVPSHGGQLQVAGVVVGSWGANYGRSQAPLRHQPQVTSVGFGAGNGRINLGYHGAGQRGYASLPTKQIRTGNNTRGKKNNKKKTQNKTKNKPRGMTVDTGNGETILASELLKNDCSASENSCIPKEIKQDTTKNVSSEDGSVLKSKTLLTEIEHHGQGDAPVQFETSH